MLCIYLDIQRIPFPPLNSNELKYHPLITTPSVMYALIFENEQRSWFGNGWKHHSWSTTEGEEVAAKEAFPKPEHAQWGSDDWRLVTSPLMTDAECWSYATSPTSGSSSFTETEDMFKMFRRRMWRRPLQPSADAPLSKSFTQHKYYHEPVHLVVLLHGWIGSPSDVENIKRELYQSFCEPVLVHVVSGNVSKTSDGIESGAVRAAKEVMDQLVKFPEISRLSIIGHSLGGLYGR